MKCISACSGLSKPNCKNKCTYVGNKYCRLSSTYKMVPPDCIVTKKTKTMKKIKILKKSELTEDKSFFEYDKFTYATLIRSIGETSLNGFVKEIKYERDGRVGYAVLKTSLKKNTDNLAYEYLVGQFLNEQSKRFPCFVETYGLFLYSRKQLEEVKKNNTDLTALTRVDPFDLQIVCKSSDRMCILTEHVNEAISLSQAVSYDFLHYESVFCLYQVYFPLAQLAKQFTHYDLNLNNVLLYPLKKNYIEYHYHGTTTTSFKSRYIVKIIDYGRCFIPTALDYESKLCAKCKDCGKDAGLQYLRRNRQFDRIYQYVNSGYKNESFDLLLFQGLFWGNKHKSSIITPLQEMANDLTYGFMKYDGMHKNGTEENVASNSKINHVGDLEKRLREFLHTTEVKNMNEDSYAKDTKLGDMHVYTDRPLEFLI